MEACCTGHVEVVRELIKAGANVNYMSNTHNTALIYACAAGHFEVFFNIKFLILLF